MQGVHLTLGVGDRRILQVLHRIFRLYFAHSLKELRSLIIYNYPAILHYSSATTILNENPEHVLCYVFKVL